MRKLSLLVLVGACASDEPPLNAQEQAVMMAQIFSGAGTALAEAQPPAGSTLVGTPAIVQINKSAPCPSGGNYAVAGMASGFMDMNGNGQVNGDIMFTFTSCGSIPVSGHTFIINGAPYRSLTLGANWAGGALTRADMTFSGAFCWDDGCAQPNGTGDGKKVCDIRVSFDLVRATGSGHICDAEINFGR